MKISLIAAMSENGVIGNNNALPWHLPEELAYFKKVTLGKPMVMGRKTFEALGCKPLPRRQNIILSQDLHFSAIGCAVVHSVAEAMAVAGDCEELMVIGGAQVFELFLPLASHIYLTVVHKHCIGDTYFPRLDWDQWTKVSEKIGPDFTTQLWVAKTLRL